MPTGLAPLCPGWKLPGLYTLGVEFLEHAPPDQAACGRNRETEHIKKNKDIPSINPLCITSLQLLELRPTFNS